MSSSACASHVHGSARYALSTTPILRSPSSHGVRIGRKTSCRSRGTSLQRVGRFSYIVSAYLLTHVRCRAMSRNRSKRPR